MGLTFSVGQPEEVFTEPVGRLVRHALSERYGNAIALDDDAEHYWSDEVAWSGWSDLQELARENSSSTPNHLLNMEAWCGVYVPLETDPGAFEFEDHRMTLEVAPLPGLINELETLGRFLTLPTDDEELRKLAAKYVESDELVDSDMDIQTYAQLLLAAHEAKRRRAPLWVVK